MATVEQIMKRMGFEETERGPFVTELRESVTRQVAGGLISRSGGTWAENCYERDENGFIVGYKISAEDRAKELLAWDWEVANGRTVRVDCFEPPIWRTFNTKTMRRGIRVRWRLLWPWYVTDPLHRLVSKLRRSKVRNPYLSA